MGTLACWLAYNVRTPRSHLWAAYCVIVVTMLTGPDILYREKHLARATLHGFTGAYLTKP